MHARIGFVDDAPHFGVDLLGHFLAIVALFGHFAAQEDQFILLAELQRPHGFRSCHIW